MKFTQLLDASYKPYWLAETQPNGRLLLVEGDTEDEALSNAIELMLDIAKWSASRKFTALWRDSVL